VLFAGGSLIFPNSSNKGFDVRVVKQSLENPFLAANTLVVVPAMLVALFGSDERTKARRKTYLEVRLILIGGQSASGPLVQKIERTFPNARIVQTYACTEAASSLTFMYVNSKDVSKGIVKKPVPNGDCVGTTPAHVNIRLYKRNESGKVWNILSLPFEPGVIATRGPHLMNGYWQRGATQQQNRSGWFLTNDLGFFDNDGKLYFCGRAKDTIRTGGETVLAQEVERVLLQHPDISECAVFPRLDERFGEAVACAIVATRQSLQLGAIKEWCQEHGLASYKRPRYLFLVDELPKNTSGKILKHKLVQLYGDRVTSKL
jgi:acyl-CoA synthetase (AMP-forming)/AMP-acid ligase II